MVWMRPPLIKFQSTSLVRGTTLGGNRVQINVHISIHVPREGDDCLTCWKTLATWKFQSTSPVRGTTLCAVAQLAAGWISIHVPREGDDL